MNKITAISLINVLVVLNIQSMEAPKRASDYLESSTSKKICLEAKQSSLPLPAIYYLCKAMCNNKLCYEKFGTEGLLKRHLREIHGFSPRHVGRYSTPMNHCSAEFK